MRSGVEIAILRIAVIDAVGNVDVDEEYRKGELAIKTPSANGTIQGILKTSAYAGIFIFMNIKCISNPGSGYTVTFTAGLSPRAIKTDKIDFDFRFRKCEIGEIKTAEGECKMCRTGEEFSLAVPTDQSRCQTCPGSRMHCLGGKNIGPKAGYWMPDKADSEIYKCYRPKSCKGVDPIVFKFEDQCANGYEGPLCAQCSHGFYHDGYHECKECAH